MSFSITVEFESAEEGAYAHMFLDRCSFDEFYGRTEPHPGREVRTERGYRMRHAVGCIETALEKAGVPKRIYT